MNHDITPREFDQLADELFSVLDAEELANSLR